MTITDPEYRLDLTAPAYRPPCLLSGDQVVDWIGHEELRPAEWVIELFGPPAVPKPGRIFTCTPCKNTLTSDLAQDIHRLISPDAYARVIRRLV